MAFCIDSVDCSGVNKGGDQGDQSPPKGPGKNLKFLKCLPSTPYEVSPSAPFDQFDNLLLKFVFLQVLHENIVILKRRLI